MRHLILTPTLVACLLLGLASPVLAGEWVEGDGYRFRLPDGYAAIDEGSLGGGALSMSVGQGVLGSDIEMEMHFFARDPSTPGRSVLTVMRMTASGELGRQMRQQFDVDKMMSRLEQERERAGEMMGLGGAQIEEIEAMTLGAGQRAVLMGFYTEQPGVGEQRIRMALTTFGESVYVFMLMGSPDDETREAVAWGTFTTSIQLSEPNAILHFVKKRWPVLAGGVLLLFLVILLLRSAGPKPSGHLAIPGGGGAGGGISRATDGLPTYDDGMVASAGGYGSERAAPPRVPLSAPRQEEAVPARPGPAPSPYGGQAPAVSVPGGPAKRTIPLSQVDEDSRGVVAQRKAREEARAAARRDVPEAAVERNGEFLS